MSYSSLNSNIAGIPGASSFRNKIINGNFPFWQRGTSLSAGVGGYLADRWNNSVSGATTAPSQQAFTAGQTDVPYEPTFFHRSVIVAGSGTTDYASVFQSIENVRTLAGQAATLSFYAKADAAKNICTEVLQNFGSGGSASVRSFGMVTCTLTTSWQKFTIPVSFPSISGKTIGAGSYVNVIFWQDAGSAYNAYTNSLGHQSGTFDIAQVQLEAGSIATPFEIRPYTVELALCQRYCQRMGRGGHYPIIRGYNTTGVAVRSNISLPVTMYSPPLVTVVGTWGTANSSQPTNAGTSIDGILMSITITSTGDGQAYPSTDANYLLLEAEI